MALQDFDSVKSYNILLQRIFPHISVFNYMPSSANCILINLHTHTNANRFTVSSLFHILNIYSTITLECIQQIGELYHILMCYCILRKVSSNLPYILMYPTNRGALPHQCIIQLEALPHIQFYT
jgi:hypothetical protein